jgi:hypothetical protein
MNYVNYCWGVANGSFLGGAGGIFLPNKRRKADIPKYLGEQAIANSFDDDNISAISQHTLDDMYAKHGTSSYNNKYNNATIRRIPTEDVPMFSASFFTSVFPSAAAASGAPTTVTNEPHRPTTATMVAPTTTNDFALTPLSSSNSRSNSKSSSPRHVKNKNDHKKKKSSSSKRRQQENGGYNLFRYFQNPSQHPSSSSVNGKEI